MSTAYDNAAETARQYYNSTDADTFYAEVWGGEDIHIGLYQSDQEAISQASRRTVEHLADRLVEVPNGNADGASPQVARPSQLGPQSVILDIGSGYGGAARHLTRRWDCQVIGLNLAETENARHRELNQQAGLSDQIKVIDGSFEKIPLADQSVDAVWSQDAMLHSGNRVTVLREVDRVLRPGGKFVFTDPMQADDCPEGVLQPILSRIHLTDLGSPDFYRSNALKLGWQDLGFEPMTHQLVRHYTRVLEITEARTDDLSEKISPDYLMRMKAGLHHWIDGGKAGHLAWGVFLFAKP